MSSSGIGWFTEAGEGEGEGEETETDLGAGGLTCLRVAAEGARRAWKKVSWGLLRGSYLLLVIQPAA